MYRYQESPPPPPPAGSKNTNTLAIISLISGILSIPFGLVSLCIGCLAAISLILGLAGAVTGFIGKKQIDESGGPQTGRKMAVAGMIFGVVGILLSVLAFIIAIVTPFLFSGLLDLFNNLLEDYLSS